MFTQSQINNLTLDEKIHYGIVLQSNELVLFRDEIVEDVESDIEKRYESALEQSEFRAEALSEVLDLCKNSPCRYKETKELIKAIQDYIENSYVEL